MQGDGSAATAMLGLPGFVLLAVSEVAGELEQAIETTAAEEFCRGCGVQAVTHGRRPVRVRDLPAAGRPVTLIWVKRVWRCAEPACAARTWTEASEHVVARASLTERARAEACRRVGEDGHEVAAVAVEYGVGWHTMPEATVSGTATSRQWALENLHEPMTLTDLAEHSHMSPRTFARRFTEEVGMSPGRWLIQQRVDRARHLLETTDQPVDEIAGQIGFAGGTSLREHLHAAIGVSPLAYRRTFRGALSQAR